ncbi:hypothetical protein BU26DRAFT_32280 [Trematosphaeria pertusa]|uniref:Uncharacterized protein n=1 Tax=Trematosphaeria pertusa TaxID=390896 RepID=A0A6A6J2Z1_9PLEO|nr:uncharacterized protein BU26DRAFT_32280 [Trematosphaeria pertusa]KAF2256938.1 hypothetical protein BU26DRAFT_32280 [Trematosphaeria pertusa]
MSLFARIAFSRSLSSSSVESVSAVSSSSSSASATSASSSAKFVIKPPFRPEGEESSPALVHGQNQDQGKRHIARTRVPAAHHQRLGKLGSSDGAMARGSSGDVGDLELGTTLGGSWKGGYEGGERVRGGGRGRETRRETKRSE